MYGNFEMLDLFWFLWEKKLKGVSFCMGVRIYVKTKLIVVSYFSIFSVEPFPLHNFGRLDSCFLWILSSPSTHPWDVSSCRMIGCCLALLWPIHELLMIGCCSALLRANWNLSRHEALPSHQSWLFEANHANSTLETGFGGVSMDCCVEGP